MRCIEKKRCFPEVSLNSIAPIIKLQVQIDGFDYVGLGSATSKKDAETNAAKDFCGFLIGAGIIPPDSFPDDLFVSCMVYHNLFHHY